MAQFLDKSGTTTLWSKVKGLIKTNITDKLAAANGIATLDSNKKLVSSQLPTLKTINNESIVGSGNITIDLNIYQVVETLPTSNINTNKIYLLLSSSSGDQNIYSEYIRVNNAWEKLGEYKAEVDLTQYIKTADVDSKVSSLGYTKNTGTVTSVKVGTQSYNPTSGVVSLPAYPNYVLPAATDSSLGGIKVWTGTQEEYDAIGTKQNDVFYFITEE